ncbi:MAG TPA: hypothetical protein VIM48_02260 [Chthoniobacterales bacterium]
MPDYEQRDASTRGVWIFAASLTAAIALVLLAAGFLFHFLATHPRSLVQASRIVEPGGPEATPALQVDPAAELDRYQKKEQELLNSYAWVDRRAGIVRIPIDRAMSLVLQRGVNAGPGAPPPQPITPLQMQELKAREQIK